MLPGVDYMKKTTDIAKWKEYYQSGNPPWDTGQPSPELRRVLETYKIQPCRALEIGCGTGTNCVWLAQQGFDVTGLDVVPMALEQARARAHDAGAAVHFVEADILTPPDLGEPFAFYFDRGCYHAVRRENPHDYAPAVARLLKPGAFGLILAGNAREPHDPGPPVVTEEQIRDELGTLFQIVDLHEFRFDATPGIGASFLAWSCLVAYRSGQNAKASMTFER
jgi:SAM-dependent methyltransferase